MLPKGANAARKEFASAIDDESVPGFLKSLLFVLLEELREIETRIQTVEGELKAIAKEDERITRLMGIPGIGLITATALLASVGAPEHFRSARHLSAWIGLTPKEHSTGNTRRLGKISKRGDKYLRTLLTHGARSVLLRARTLHAEGRPLDRLQRWARDLEQRSNHNKATCAVANKLARIAWACWNSETDYRREFAIAA